MPAQLGPRLRPLRKLLVGLYPGDREVRRVLSDIGVPAGDVPSGESATTLWHEALTVVVRHGLLKDLVELATDEAPSRSDELREIVAAIEPFLPRTRTAERLMQLAHEGEAATSEVLSWPSTLPSGASIERPERRAIEQHLADPDVGVIVLLGEAGCGKSALLATIGNALRDAGQHVLGMRLDRLGKNVTTDEQLQAYLNLSESLAGTVEALASRGPITVIVDQLDALCDLMTERAGRLALVLNTIEDLASIDNVHVLLACRPYEFHHDVRLRRVRAADITIALPSWEDVEPHVVAAGVEPATLRPELREELRKPLTLRTFLDLLRQGHDWRQLPTYHAMRERLWESHVSAVRDGGRRRQVLFDLAQWMAREEVLTRPAAQMDDCRPEIGALESAGWLQLVGLASNAGVTFRHQSLFDFAYARAIVASGGLVLEQVLLHQGLFIRRRVWSILAYLREASLGQYIREFERLWRAPGLRRHLKRLLIDFLGQVPRPESREIGLLRGALADAQWRKHALFAIGKGTGWFEVLQADEVPRAMVDPETAGLCVPVLAGAPAGEAEHVLDLLSQYWASDVQSIARSVAVMTRLPTWSSRGFQIAKDMARRVPVDNEHVLDQLMSAVAPMSAREASEVFASALEAQASKTLADFHAKPEPPRPADTADVVEHMLWRREVEERGEPLRNLFEGAAHWVVLADIIDADPEAFLLAIWPTMVKVLDALVDCSISS